MTKYFVIYLLLLVVCFILQYNVICVSYKFAIFQKLFEDIFKGKREKLHDTLKKWVLVLLKLFIGLKSLLFGHLIIVNIRSKRYDLQTFKLNEAQVYFKISK